MLEVHKEWSGQDDAGDRTWTRADYERFVGHADADVRAWALRRLTLLHPESATELAIQALRDAAYEVQSAALRRIATLDPLRWPLPADALRAYVGRRDIPPGLRSRALGMLAAGGDARAAAELLELRRQVRARFGIPDGPAEEDGAKRDDEVRIPEEADDTLRQRAALRLGRTGPEETLALLDALERCPWRWAARLVGDRLGELLATPVADEVWDAVVEIGDPSLLGAVLDEWRAGELRVARAAVFLATLGGRLAGVPAAVRAEAKEHRRRLADIERRMVGDEDPLAGDDPLTLKLRCTGCGRTYTYEVEHAYVHPDIGKRGRRLPQGWDGVVLSRLIACKRCHAEDAYELTAAAKLRLLGELTTQLVRGSNPEIDRKSWRVIPAVRQTWDGTLLRRPTQGLEHLRALCKKRPTEAEPWRRLGNLCERFGLMREAEDAWRRAAADESEIEAAYSLAIWLGHDGRPQQGLDFALKAVERISGAKLAQDARAAMAEALCEILRAAAPRIRPPLALMAAWTSGRVGDHAVVRLSSVDLRDIRRGTASPV